MLEETYRLAKENNKLLHAMRRSAFLGRLVKFIFYILILVVAPLWVYTTYLAPLVGNLQQTLNQIQGTNAKAQSGLNSLQSALKQVESKIPGFSPSTQ